MHKVLIVEDDVNLGTPLAGVLEAQNFKVVYLTSGETAIEVLREFKPDIVLLDVVLNGSVDGFDIGKAIRMESRVPIIFTTSRDGNDDFKAGFGLENSDYVKKPYKLMEVLLRVNSMLTRQEHVNIIDNAYQIGNLTFLPGEQSINYSFERIHLNYYESAVMTMLCQNIGKYVSKTAIINHVWNEKDPKLKEGSLNNVLSNIRKYIEIDNRIKIDSKIKLGVKLTINEDE